jgi:hypothetical protein
MEEDGSGTCAVVLQSAGQCGSVGLRTPLDTPVDCVRLSAVFTTIESTGAALLAAKSLSAGLDADVVLIMPKPYPLALDRPPVSPEVALRTLRDLACSVGARTSLYVWVCRDVLEALLAKMPADIHILFGLRRRGFVPGFLFRPAAALRRRGREVITVEYR